MDWMSWLGEHRAVLGWLVVISAVTLAASAIALPWIVVRIPVDYFADGRDRALPWANRHPVVRLTLLIGKNLLGLVLILAGIAMLVLPGQGVLTIIAGLALVDFPGRHRLVRRFVCQQPVLRSLNWIRTRAGKPLLVVDCASPDAASESASAGQSRHNDGPLDRRSLDTPS